MRVELRPKEISKGEVRKDLKGRDSQELRGIFKGVLGHVNQWLDEVFELPINLPQVIVLLLLFLVLRYVYQLL